MRKLQEWKLNDLCLQSNAIGVTEWWRMICGGRNLKLEGKGPFRR
jgi:hypothetical protein